MTTFKQLGLSNEILKALTELGFETPTEIQERAIPILLESFQDFIGLAQTGTGKTAAFGLPLLENIDPFVHHTQALVLAPTRELGQQIAEQLHKFSKYFPKINVLAVYGGAAITNQMKALKKPQHIIIATPGRLLDLIKRKAVKLEQLQYLVLDEADEMLNMGFKEDLDAILSYTPDTKLTWLFSATMPDQIKRIVQKYMDKPQEVRINPKQEVNVNIEHQYCVVKSSDKTEALSRFLDLDPNMRALVFCRTRRDTQNLAEALMQKNYKADALHGDLSQGQRDKVMRRFKKHSLQILIATDVAARGIDVNDLTHVFHFTLPDDMAYYTHRSGRTARAGKKGISMAFIGGRDQHKIRRIEKQLGISFKAAFIPKSDDIADIRLENWCNQIIELNTRGKIDRQLVNKAEILFDHLTKDELIAKMLTYEFQQLNLGNSKDLNIKSSSSSSKSNFSKKGKDKRNYRDKFRDRKKFNKKGGKPKRKKAKKRWGSL